MIYTHICKFCHKELSIEAQNNHQFASLVAAHEGRCEFNPNREQYFLAKYKAGKRGGKSLKEKWEKILKKEKENAINYEFICETCKKTYLKFLTIREFKKYKQLKHYCSRSCANTRIKSEESKRKTSLSVLMSCFKKDSRGCKSFEEYCKMREKENSLILCKHPGCQNLVSVKNKTGFCKKHLSDDKIHIEKMRRTQLQQYKDGKRCGWIRRNIESYPEKFFKKVLEKNHIQFVFNYPIQKSKLGYKSHRLVHYFLDFKIGDNIDLEIDGKQHLNFQNRIHDKERDEALRKNGWLIYRISWNEINTKEGKQMMKNKIKDFLLWLEENNNSSSKNNKFSVDASK